MKMRSISLLILLSFVSFLVVGCATIPKPRTITNEFEFAQDYDKVWASVIGVFAEKNYPIDNMEKDSGLITTDFISFFGTKNTDYCDCGSGGLLTEKDRTGKFNVFLKKMSSGGVALRINTKYMVTRDFNGSRSSAACVSTGTLEKQLYTLIAQKMAEQ